MKSTFIALPLSSGEAFLLRTEDDSGRSWTILVDGGKKYGEDTRELAKLLSNVSPASTASTSSFAPIRTPTTPKACGTFRKTGTEWAAQ